MNHDDDTLILYYYGDGLDAAERARIDAALRDDPALALRYLELTAMLARLRLAPEVEPPPAAVHRWQTSVARAARLETAASPPASRWRLRLAFAGAALAAAVLAIGLIARLPIEPPSAPPPFAAQPAPTERAGAATPLQRGVQAHLQETGQLIDRLAGNGERHGAALADAIERNRAYQRSAERHDAERLARLLRAFEPALERLADADTDRPTFEAERERLAFELGVAESGLAHAPARFL